MARKFIGVEIGASEVRIAVAAAEKGAVTLVRTATAATPAEGEVMSAVRGLLDEERHFGDQLAVALPAGAAFVRWLRLPFSDPKKIEAAFAFDLAAQIPLPIEECLADFHASPSSGDEGVVIAAAVRRAAIGGLVESFEQAGIDLHRIDLAPFAYAGGLRQQCQDAVLAALGESDATASLIRAGQVVDFRRLAVEAETTAAALAAELIRSTLTLCKANGSDELPLVLIGSRATAELKQELEQQQQRCSIPVLSAAGRPVAPEFLPVAALALGGARAGKGKTFNFRRGPYALKSEWTALKRTMTAAAILVALSAAVLAASAYLNYSAKARRATALQQQMIELYRQTFPGPGAIVDVPLQMRSKLEELKKKGRLGGDDDGLALEALLEISRRIPPELTVDLREMSFSSGEVRLDGVTPSFDAVNRMARGLGQSPLFREAKIADAKMNLDGSQVDFRLQLTLAEKRGAP